MTKIFDKSKGKKSYAPSNKVVSKDNIYPAKALVTASAPTNVYAISTIKKLKDNEMPIFWDGYTIGINRLHKTIGTNVNLVFGYGQHKICDQIEATITKFDPTYDIVDFARTVVGNWTEVREYLDIQTGGYERIPDIPNLYTIRFHLGDLLAWYKTFLDNGRSILATFGVPIFTPATYSYVSPPISDIVNKQQALDFLMDEYFAEK